MDPFVIHPSVNMIKESIFGFPFLQFFQHRRKGVARDKKRSRPGASRRRTHAATAACGSVERPQPVPRKMARGETSAAAGRRLDALSGGGAPNVRLRRRRLIRNGGL